MLTGFGLGNLKESNSLDDLGLDGRILLYWILNK